MNHSNNDGRTPAENAEGRPRNKENTRPSCRQPTQSEARVSQGLAGVRKAAKQHQKMRFTALLHHLTVDLLRESFYALKRKAAGGRWREVEEYRPGGKVGGSICTAGFTGELIERPPGEGYTSGRTTGGKVRWGWRRGRTRWSNRP